MFNNKKIKILENKIKSLKGEIKVHSAKSNNRFKAIKTLEKKCSSLNREIQRWFDRYMDYCYLKRELTSINAERKYDLLIDTMLSKRYSCSLTMDDHDYNSIEYNNAQLVYKTINEIIMEVITKMEKISCKKILELFKDISCNGTIKYYLYNSNEDYYEFVIKYCHNQYGILHNEYNELCITLNKNKTIAGIEFDSEGDRISINPAWRYLSRAISEDLEFDLDIEFRSEN